jgi:hypothetical protein
MIKQLVDREWYWLDDGVLPYALCAMRSLWIWLLLHLAARALTPTRGDWIALPLIFALLAGSTWLAQICIFKVKDDFRAIAFISISGLVAIVVTVYLDVGFTRAAIWDWHWLQAIRDDIAGTMVVLFIAVFLWRWGILTGRTHQLYDVFSFAFTIGTLVFGVVFGVAFGTNIVSAYELALPLLAFFAIGLGSLALSSLQDARRFEGNRTGQQIGVNRYWVATIVILIGILLAGGLVSTLLFAPEAFSGMLTFFAFIFDLAMKGLFLLVLVVSFIIFSILGFFAQFLPPLQPLKRDQNIELPQGFEEQLKALPQKTPAQLPAELHLVLEIGTGIIILGAILLVFAFAFRRFRYLEPEEGEEIRETVFSIDLLKQQLGDLFGRSSAKKTQSVPPFVVLDSDDHRAKIRQIYQELLAWVNARGVSRPPGMTPNEFLVLLNRLLPSQSERFAVLNAIYIRARYSAASISTEDVREVTSAWESIVRAEV